MGFTIIQGPKHQEMRAFTKIGCSLLFPRREGTPCHAESHGEAPGLSGGRKNEAKTWAEDFIVSR